MDQNSVYDFQIDNHVCAIKGQECEVTDTIFSKVIPVVLSGLQDFLLMQPISRFHFRFISKFLKLIFAGYYLQKFVENDPFDNLSLYETSLKHDC